MSQIEYVNIPLETDPDILSQDAFEYIQLFIANWVPSDGNLDVRIISAIARMAAESRDVVTDVPTTIFRYFGTNLVNLPSLDGTPATINLTFTARDNLGYTIPGGTHVQATDGSGNISYWTTISDAIIAPGNTSITPVPALGSDDGTAFNGLTFSSGQITMVDSLSFILQVDSVGATDGGVDAEDDPTYLSRLATDLTLLSPKPIVPTDFAILSKNFSGIARAIAVDGYDLIANTFSNAKTITVFVVDSAGATPPSPTITAIQVYLASLREAGFIIYVAGPHFTGLSTQYAVTAEAGVDKPTVKAAIDAAIIAFLSPATWGIDRITGGAGSTANNTWNLKPFVRLSELTAVIQDVPGVDTITTLTMSSVAADYDLTVGGSVGPVALPSWVSGSSTGVVT